ncbi:PfkB family carbohydrate kinase [Methanobacterium sp. ACI-7]|uniref:PfkB family carbohydrate kinase n=1 Tax=unclassified Methanobacterium TaxID=2627676 RepID=UPI0039C2F176
MSIVTLIGPVSEDIIIKEGKRYKSIGGAVFYQSSVFSNLNINTNAVITVSKKYKESINSFFPGTSLFPIYVKDMIKYQNIYPDNNLNHRTQKAEIPCNPITIKNIIQNIENSDVTLLGPLSPNDIPLETIKKISKLKIPLYLGAQGYLRHLEEDKIVLKPWTEFKKYLKFIDILFIDENEARILQGNHNSLESIAKILSSFGPYEVIITCGSKGSIIYSRKFDEIYKIPAFKPKITEDPTGLGDTYMAAYTARKLETDSPQMCGIFAAAVSSLKLENRGPFNGNKKLILERCKNQSI